MLLHINPTRQRGKRTGSLARASGWYMTFFAAGVITRPRPIKPAPRICRDDQECALLESYAGRAATGRPEYEEDSAIVGSGNPAGMSACTFRWERPTSLWFEKRSSCAPSRTRGLSYTPGECVES
jgi:hypothetical protein